MKLDDYFNTSTKRFNFLKLFVFLYFTQFYIREQSLINTLYQAKSIESLQTLLLNSNLQHLLLPKIAILFLSGHQSLVLDILSLFSIFELLLLVVALYGIVICFKRKDKYFLYLMISLVVIITYYASFVMIAFYLYNAQSISEILFMMQTYTKIFYFIFVSFSLAGIILSLKLFFTFIEKNKMN